MNTEKLKKLSIQTMIGGLIGAAVIAVAAVLAGSFNDTFARALFTLILVMVHALVCLGLIEQTTKAPNKNFRFFENTAFFLIVMSFITSIFGVWQVLSGNVVAELYGTYGVLFFACLHGVMLSQTQGKQRNIDNIVHANYVFMAFVILMIFPLIWAHGTDYPGIYYRILAALGIVDATLSILAVILHRMYVQKHPTVNSTIFSAPTRLDANGHPVPVQAEIQKRHIHPLIFLLGILIFGQLVISLLFAALGAFYNR